MPFEAVTPSPDVAWLSRGLPAMILTSLAQSRGLDVISVERVDELAGALGDDGGVADRRRVLEVARRAGAGALITGRIYATSHEMRIDAELQDVETGPPKLCEASRCSRSPTRSSAAFATVYALRRAVTCAPYAN
jgi:TolB-like protein